MIGWCQSCDLNLSSKSRHVALMVTYGWSLSATATYLCKLGSMTWISLFIMDRIVTKINLHLKCQWRNANHTETTFLTRMKKEAIFLTKKDWGSFIDYKLLVAKVTL